MTSGFHHWISFLLFMLQLVERESSLVLKRASNNPACHPGMLHIFNWCEQSNCGSNCTCLEPKRVCKQICDKPNCGLLFCSSPLTCHQSVIREPDTSPPAIHKMIAHSPRSEQECNKGHCSLLIALRYENLRTTTFQSCADGTCDKLHSHADVAQQFCGNCKTMKCSGKHSTNCTQYCVLGKCPDMTCNARHCKQLCLHSSTCNLTCGPRAQTCEQTCSHNSNCTMQCDNPNAKCTQTCNKANNCTRVQQLRTTRTTLSTALSSSSTTRSTMLPTTNNIDTTTTTVEEPTTTEMSNHVEQVDERRTNDRKDISSRNIRNEVSDFYQSSSRTLEVHLITALICISFYWFHHWLF